MQQTQEAAMRNILRMKRPDDMPLLIKRIRRVRKGDYELSLYFVSGRLYGRERFNGRDMAQAIERCRRLYPSTVFVCTR
jgi:hypothetical protein